VIGLPHTDDFPPAPDRLVTLSNWRKAPFSPGGFRNVRRLIPTANVAASGHAAGLQMSLDAQGAMRAAGGICVAPRDLARFGEMISRRGVADGQQVVPGAWIDDINERGDPEAWARSEMAEIFPQTSYRSQWYRIDRTKGVLCALGIHGQWINIHPEAELVIIGMASEATPLDLDRVRGWRRGFDAIAEYFLYGAFSPCGGGLGACPYTAFIWPCDPVSQNGCR
jgi:CubicO group peptidase (beta-lactamase class C family)